MFRVKHPVLWLSYFVTNQSTYLYEWEGASPPGLFGVAFSVAFALAAASGEGNGRPRAWWLTCEYSFSLCVWFCVCLCLWWVDLRVRRAVYELKDARKNKLATCLLPTFPLDPSEPPQPFMLNILMLMCVVVDVYYHHHHHHHHHHYCYY